MNESSKTYHFDARIYKIPDLSESNLIGSHQNLTKKRNMNCEIIGPKRWQLGPLLVNTPKAQRYVLTIFVEDLSLKNNINKGDLKRKRKTYTDTKQKDFGISFNYIKYCSVKTNWSYKLLVRLTLTQTSFKAHYTCNSQSQHTYVIFFVLQIPWYFRNDDAAYCHQRKHIPNIAIFPLVKTTKFAIVQRCNVS